MLDRRLPWSEPLTADELLDRADRALLLAKRTGKSRVAAAGAGLEQELELVEARAGSPEATMREFWEMVAASESNRKTLLTLPPSSTARSTPTRSRSTSSGTTSCSSRPPRPAASLLAAIGADEPPEARLAPAGAYAVVPLLWAGHPHGLIAVRTRRQLSTERLRLLELVARQTMAVFSAQPESGSPAAVQALAAAIEARDNCTHDHSEQVVSLATSPSCWASPPPSRTPSATARCCTTSASSRSRTRSSTSPDR